MSRNAELVCALACLCGWGLATGVAEAAASFPRAEVRGVQDRALRALLQRSVGDAPTRPASRIEARRRAREAADAVVASLRSEGYYDYEVTSDIGEGDAPVPFVTVAPGPRTFIAGAAIVWTGAAPTPPAAAAAARAVDLPDGKAGRAEWVIAAEGRAVAALRKAGYADAAAGPREVIVDHADHTMRPAFHILAGDAVRLGEVRLAAPGRTRLAWVQALAPWRLGDAYKPETLVELQKRLTDTGAYDAVSVALAPAEAADGGVRPVIVTLADRPRGSIAIGLSYSTTEGVGADSSWTLHNLVGRADTLANTLRIASIDSRLQTQFSLPDFRSADQTLKLTGALYRDNTPAYSDDGIGVSADLTRKFRGNSYVTVGASVDGTHTTEKEAANYVRGSKERGLATIGLLGAFAYDRSNDPLNPTRGWKLDARVEPTLATGDGSIAFLKASAQASAYLPLDAAGATVVAARAKLGSIFGGDIPGVPAQDRFYAGGGGSVRGYGYQSVGPRYPDNHPEGGLSLFETSVEIRRALTPAWSIAAFADAGAVGFHIYPDFREPSIGAGIGVRYNLGFGPIRIDLATPLNPRRGDSIVQVYLSIGQSF